MYLESHFFQFFNKNSYLVNNTFKNRINIIYLALICIQNLHPVYILYDTMNFWLSNVFDFSHLSSNNMLSSTDYWGHFIVISSYYLYSYWSCWMQWNHVNEVLSNTPIGTFLSGNSFQHDRLEIIIWLDFDLKEIWNISIYERCLYQNESYIF